ncbi:hypothetical protein CFOL_v3_25634, partial [Cephalotus follicularis]
PYSPKFLISSRLISGSHSRYAQVSTKPPQHLLLKPLYQTFSNYLLFQNPYQRKQNQSAICPNRRKQNKTNNPSARDPISSIQKRHRPELRSFEEERELDKVDEN